MYSGIFFSIFFSLSSPVYLEGTENGKGSREMSVKAARLRKIATETTILSRMSRVGMK